MHVIFASPYISPFKSFGNLVVFMIVQCVGNDASHLPLEDVDFYGTLHTKFSVEVGKSYTVYAMQMHEGRIDILIRDSSGGPDWNPIKLFRVVDSRIPAHWEFASFFDPSGEVERRREEIGERWGFRPDDSARWGYPEIVHSDEHYLGIVDARHDDLRRFYREEQRIKNEQECEGM